MNSPVDSTDSPSDTDKQSSEEADGSEDGLPEEEEEFYFLVNGVCKRASKVNGSWFGSLQECCMSIVSVCMLEEIIFACLSLLHVNQDIILKLPFCFFQPSLEDRNDCLEGYTDNKPSSPVPVSDFSNGGANATMGSSMLIVSLLFFQLM